MKIRLTEISNNKKVGRIPVTTTERASCPDSCKLKNICYAQKGKTRMIWEEVERGINTRWDSKFENDWLAIMKKIDIKHLQILKNLIKKFKLKLRIRYRGPSTDTYKRNPYFMHMNNATSFAVYER